jgi:glycosyltransferase involved in cell wall biosynthesis
MAQMQARANMLEQTLDRLVNEMAKEKYRQENKNGQTCNVISVVIPAYNEASSISTVLGALPKAVLGMPVEAIVVVDGSTDETEAVVRAHNVGVATHIINRGGGAALHVGYDLALERRSKVVVTLDADGQHLPDEIERLVAPIINDQADMVNGSRVLGTYEKEQAIRAIGVVFFNGLISLLMMRRITDCSNAFRAISGEDLAEVRPHLIQRQYHSPELLIEMLKRNKRVIEVPVTVRKRVGGESKKGPTLRYALGFSISIIATWLR